MDKNIYIGIAVVVTVAVGMVFYFYTRSGEDFSSAYAAYAEVAEQHDTAAYIPAVADNPERRELNRILSEMLMREDLSAGERLALAERGIGLLREIEEQIDSIGEIGGGVRGAVEDMEEAAGGIGSFHLERGRREVIELAKKRLAIIADIRGLSYRANYHTKEIFDRLIQDGGVLTDAHVTYLNNQIPRAEEQFDRRAALYIELESAGHEMEILTAD